jgi:hypothetical protein
MQRAIASSRYGHIARMRVEVQIDSSHRQGTRIAPLVVSPRQPRALQG